MPVTVDAVVTVDGFTAYRDGTSGSGATVAVGTITAVAKASLADTETFTLDDGTNPTKVFEFDLPPDGVGGANVQVDVSADVTDIDVTVREALSLGRNAPPELSGQRAIVAARSAIYGIARAYEAIAEGSSGFRVGRLTNCGRVFRQFASGLSTPMAISEGI